MSERGEAETWPGNVVARRMAAWLEMDAFNCVAVSGKATQHTRDAREVAMYLEREASRRTRAETQR